MNDNDQQVSVSEPLFLYVSPMRLVLLSILSFSLYEVYWMYKNWRHIKERDGLKIRPFWRAIFGIFFCHSLLRRIHGDQEAQSIQEPTFSPDTLATGWVILVIIGNLVSRSPEAVAGVLAAFIPSFLCLVPVQKYINEVTQRRNSEHNYSPWSLGHIVCFVLGVLLWALTLSGLGIEA